MVKMKRVREILQQLKNEIYPDEFIEGITVEKYIVEAISIIDNGYKTEEEYNETMEKVFNEPYNKGGYRG